MLRNSLTGLDRKKLRLWLVVFFLALAIPTGILVYQAYSQLKWEAFHQYRVLAGELTERIDSRIVQLINVEEARSFADYAFLNVAGDPSASFLQRSPLCSSDLIFSRLCRTTGLCGSGPPDAARARRPIPSG